MRRFVKKVDARKDFSLKIEFDNGEIKIYDMRETLKGKVFAPIREWDRFKYVYIDSSGCIAWDADRSVGGSKVWNNHLDISADNCCIYGKSL
ncbi:MAG: DUF2442 domain-containing protein [Chitinispirillales bacterium]|jgi:hypothetical protein|nr:DUF2442 domain-containing protein [Chitinispirillales bacterium]